MECGPYTTQHTVIGTTQRLSDLSGRRAVTTAMERPSKPPLPGQLIECPFSALQRHRGERGDSTAPRMVDIQDNTSALAPGEGTGMTSLLVPGQFWCTCPPHTHTHTTFFQTSPVLATPALPRSWTPVQSTREQGEETSRVVLCGWSAGSQTGASGRPGASPRRPPTAMSTATFGWLAGGVKSLPLCQISPLEGCAPE